MLSKETLASARVMNHVHYVTFLHRYIVSVDNTFRKTYLFWKHGQSISSKTVMQFTEEHVNKRFQPHRFLYCVYIIFGEKICLWDAFWLLVVSYGNWFFLHHYSVSSQLRWILWLYLVSCLSIFVCIRWHFKNPIVGCSLTCW